MPWGDGGLSGGAPDSGGGWGSGGIVSSGNAKTAPKKSSGGIIGSVEHAVTNAGHYVAKKASLAGHDIASIPGQTYQAVNTGAVQPWKDFLTSGHVSAKHNAAIDKLTNQTLQSIGETARHPLRDPFATALLFGPVKDIPFRAGEIAARVDKTAPRILKAGNGEVNLNPPSKSALGRTVQKGYTKTLQRGLDRNPGGRVAAHANKRIAGAINEAQRARIRMHESPANQLAASGKKLSKVEQAALRATSENTPPEARAAFHEAQAKQGVNPKENLKEAALQRQVAARGMLTKDSAGNVVVDAGKFPRLAAVDKQLATVGEKGEQIVREHGLMSDEGLTARKNAPGEIVGATKPGRQFVTYKLSEAKAPKAPIARAASQVVGEPRKPITSKAFTGQGLKGGLVPDNTTRLSAQHLRSLLRFSNTHELRQQWLKTGSPLRRSDNDILVRIPGTPKGEIPAAVDNLLGRKKLTLDELHGADTGLRTGLLAQLEHILGHDDPETGPPESYGIGEKAPKGYRWVDRNVIGDYGKAFSQSRGKPGRSFDNLNSAITAATVYYKIGHVGTRYLTNATTNIIEGSATPWNIGKSLKLWKSLSHEDRLRALAASGQHGFEAMPHEGAGKIGAVATTGANWWAKHADSPFRFNAIVYEARKAGYGTPARFREFLDKLEHPEGLMPDERARIENVAKKTNRENISYDRLNEFERRFIARAFWFYPWVKGSTVFSVRTALEHPYKAAAGGVLGQSGRENQQAQLGELPSYEFGLTKVGGGSNPLVSNFNTFSPFGTAGSLAQIPEYGQASENLNPAAAGLLSLISRTNAYGQHSNSPIADALRSALAPTPEYQVANALTGHKSKMFPSQNSALEAVVRYLVGPAAPRRVDLAVAHKAAGREKSGR